MGVDSLLDFYNKELKEVPGIKGMRKFDIAGDGNCCPVSLITSMLAGGQLSRNDETRMRVAKFLKGLFDAVPKNKNVEDFLALYTSNKSEEGIKEFFYSLREQEIRKIILAMSDQLRSKAKQAIQARADMALILEDNEFNQEFEPGKWTSPDMFAVLLNDNGMKIILREQDAPAVKRANDLNSPDIKDPFIVLNIYYVSRNHYDMLISESSITQLENENNPAYENNPDDDSASQDTYATDPDQDFDDVASVGFTSVILEPESKHAAPLNYAAFKEYLLHDYSAESATGEKYSVIEDGDKINILLNKEKIATVAENSSKRGIKLNIMPDKENDGAFVALSSFKDFLEHNVSGAQKYKADFTGYDTPDKAQDFLRSFCVVCMPGDLLECDFAIKFDPASQKMIHAVLAGSVTGDLAGPEFEFKWNVMRGFFEFVPEAHPEPRSRAPKGII